MIRSIKILSAFSIFDKKNIMYFVYTIKCPMFSDVKYVGMTADIGRRIKQHLSLSEDNIEKNEWIKSVLDSGDSPVFEVIFVCDSKIEAMGVESLHIRELLKQGQAKFNRMHRKVFYKWSVCGELLETIETCRGGSKGQMPRKKRYISSGFVWSEEPVFPEWKVKRYRDARSVQKKKVAMIDKLGNMIRTFDGVRDACRETGIDHRSISQVAAGSKIRKTAGGFKWQYV